MNCKRLRQKVVFRDAGQTKVAIGTLSFEEGFVKVTDDEGKSVLINKEHVIYIKDGDF